MKKLSDHDKNVDQVAGVIYENEIDPIRADFINRTVGWGFDVIYGHEGPGNWTRVEGLQLSKDDLDTAITMAHTFGEG